MSKQSKLREAAKRYYDAGLNVLPAKRAEKRPVGAWKKWTKERPAFDAVFPAGIFLDETQATNGSGDPQNRAGARTGSGAVAAKRGAPRRARVLRNSLYLVRLLRADVPYRTSSSSRANPVDRPETRTGTFDKFESAESLQTR